MTISAHLSSLFSAAPIILWVEDVVTRDYLNEVWSKPKELAFFLAGGNSDVRLIVATAQREGVNHVFGVIDRDYRPSNRPNWHDPQITVFRLPRHEIENYLLEPAALVNSGLNNRGRTVVEVKIEMERLAALQPCWMACRRVLSEMRTAFSDGFPKDPTVAQIQSAAAAEAHIRNALWFSNIGSTAANWTTGAALTNAILAAHSDMQSHLATGDWLSEFSGAEVFRPLREYIYAPHPSHGKTSTKHDSDLAKKIGIWQEQNNAVPQDIGDLRSVLRQRVGLPP